jgi:hypothetical protein
VFVVEFQDLGVPTELHLHFDPTKVATSKLFLNEISVTVAADVVSWFPAFRWIDSNSPPMKLLAVKPSYYDLIVDIIGLGELARVDAHVFALLAGSNRRSHEVLLARIDGSAPGSAMPHRTRFRCMSVEAPKYVQLRLASTTPLSLRVTRMVLIDHDEKRIWRHELDRTLTHSDALTLSFGNDSVASTNSGMTAHKADSDQSSSGLVRGSTVTASESAAKLSSSDGPNGVVEGHISWDGKPAKISEMHVGGDEQLGGDGQLSLYSHTACVLLAIQLMSNEHIDIEEGPKELTLAELEAGCNNEEIVKLLGWVGNVKPALDMVKYG